MTGYPVAVAEMPGLSTVADARRNNLPFLEQYRPQKLEEMVGHETKLEALQTLCMNNKIPHLLLYGPAGTGKTTSILACARLMYGTYVKRMVLELNASDDRGIDVVRTQIKEFVASNTSIKDPAMEGKPKMVILDESDHMTSAAQFSLRRLVEQYSKYTRFVFICNYEDKMIQAIRSRCTKFRFGPLSKPHVIERIKIVAKAEGVEIPDTTVDALASCANGDLRKALNYFQTAVIGAKKTGAVASAADVFKAAGRGSPESLVRLGKVLLGSSLKDGAQAIYDFTVEHACTVYDLLNLVHPYLSELQIPESAFWGTGSESGIVLELADLQWRASRGLNERTLQLSMSAIFVKAGASMKK